MMMMVAAISASSTANPKTSSQQQQESSNHHNQTRPPLLPSSEKDTLNGVVGTRRPKSKEITSRYLSTSNSSSSNSTTTSSTRRCPSPLVSRPVSSTSDRNLLPTTTVAPHSMIKRSQSVERRRPATPRPTTTPLPELRTGNVAEVSSMASKILFTSTRSLSVSFQGESFSLPISKTKAVPSPTNSRKVVNPERRKAITPLRGRDQTEENSKPYDQHRWPARTRQVNIMTRSLDFTEEEKKKKKKKLIGSRAVVRALEQSMIEEGRRASFDGRLNRDTGDNADLVKSIRRALDVDSSYLTVSDTESVSSGSSSSVQECNGMVSRGRSGPPRGISVPARFWQETNSRLRRLQDPGSPSSMTTASSSRTGGAAAAAAAAPQKQLIPSKMSLIESSPISSSPRTVVSTGSGRALSSPLRGSARPASPSKLMMTYSPSRGMPSPSRTRNAAAVAANSSLTNSGNMPSILSFAADVRRGKMGENRIIDAHLLRLLYNRHLQWRFVNARTDASLLLQRLTAEKNLYNAWIATTELCDSVTVKKIKLQLLRQNLKLTSILKGQMTYLEEWALLDRDHSSSLLGAIEALKASTLRLPVVGGAKADIQNVTDAVGSAVDVMQAMASSICSFLSKLEEVNSLATELANVTAQERALLDQCKDLLSTLAALQVKDCSLRTHLLQLKRLPRNVITQG